MLEPMEKSSLSSTGGQPLRDAWGFTLVQHEVLGRGDTRLHHFTFIPTNPISTVIHDITVDGRWNKPIAQTTVT